MPFYSRPQLIEYISGKVSLEEIIIHDESWFKEEEIGLKLDEPAMGINPGKKMVFTSERRYYYDRLLITTGAQPFLPPVMDNEEKNIFTLRDIEDVESIRQKAENSNKAVVIGGGVLGVESAFSLRKLGLDVVVIAISDHLMPKQLDERGSAILQNYLEEEGLEFFLNSRVSEFSGNQELESVRFDDGSDLPADMALLCAGVRPNTELVENLGLLVDNGIVVDEYMRTSFEGVYAAGDVAEYNGRIYGLWEEARVQGETAGANMSGQVKKFSDFIPICRLKIPGIKVISGGEVRGHDKQDSEVEERANSYKKIIRNAEDKISGFIIIGEEFLKDMNSILREMRDSN